MFENDGDLADTTENPFFAGIGDPLVLDFQIMRGEQVMHAVRSIAAGKEEADGFTGSKCERLIAYFNFARTDETKICNDSFQSILRVLNPKYELAIILCNAKVG